MEFNFKQKLIRGSIIFFSVFIVIYTFFQAKYLIFGVKIKDVSIENQIQNQTNPIEITGNALHAIELTLNDREISIDKKGDFKEFVALSPGYNIIKIKAKDKFGHQDEKNYKLTYPVSRN